MTEKQSTPHEFVDLTLDEMDKIIDGNITITDSRLRDGVYGVVLDTITTLMDKNPWLVEAQQEPVLVVEREPGYWSRGHYHEGTKPHIDPTKVWNLPIGTKLYTAPPQQEPVAWMHNLIDYNIITHRPADIDRHPDRWTALYPEPKPCPTCEALARTVMMDQIGRG